MIFTDEYNHGFADAYAQFHEEKGKTWEEFVQTGQGIAQMAYGDKKQQDEYLTGWYAANVRYCLFPGKKRGVL